MDNIFVVHTMGKVGSTSVYKCLKGTYEAYHCHYLTSLDRKEDNEVLRSIIKRKSRCKVITLIREPVRRNASAFFNLVSVHKIENDFSKYPHEAPHVFLDKEIKGFWGVDVFREPFNREKGWQIYDNVLLIKQENLRQAWNEAFLVFTGTRPPKLLDHNRTFLPGYSNFKPTEEYINRMHSTKYYNHFYGDAP